MISFSGHNHINPQNDDVSLKARLLAIGMGTASVSLEALGEPAVADASRGTPTQWHVMAPARVRVA
eukprot:3353751-Prymnesium_polylepis.1